MRVNLTVKEQNQQINEEYSVDSICTQAPVIDLEPENRSELKSRIRKPVYLILFALFVVFFVSACTFLDNLSKGTEAFEVFRDRLKDGSQGPAMVRLPGGTFRMGNLSIQESAFEKEFGRAASGGVMSGVIQQIYWMLKSQYPVHGVTLSPFAIGVYEVTFAEYDRFAEVTGKEKLDDEGWGPVSSVFLDELLDRLSGHESARVLSITQSLNQIHNILP